MKDMIRRRDIVGQDGEESGEIIADHFVEVTNFCRAEKVRGSEDGNRIGVVFVDEHTNDAHSEMGELGEGDQGLWGLSLEGGH